MVPYRISIFNTKKDNRLVPSRSAVAYQGLLIMKDAFNMIGIINLSFFFVP
jgi:hypothetical protein